MKKLLCLLMLLALLPLTALAEFPVQDVTIVNAKAGQVSQTITDAAYIDLLMSMLTAPTEQCDFPELPNSASAYEVHCHLGEQKYVIYQVFHDDLYNQAWLLAPTGETFRVGCELPLLLQNTLWDSPTFTIPDEHRALLAEHGWTIAFRRSCMFETLPAELIASRTDPTALHFTWAALFLQDAGYDITPYLGKTVLPYMYYLVEPVNRVRWVPADARFLTEGGTGGVLYSMKAIVLECEGEIIGAYLMALSWDGSNLMSLDGRTAIDLLGEDGIRDYLLSHSAPDADLAALTPEEVIQRYSESHDPRLETIDGLLSRLGTAHEIGLYWRDVYDLDTIRPDPAVSILPLDFDDQYKVLTEDGEIWFPQLEWESDQTGWKIESFYNTGY
ncbi:MAG: DUF4830 domain-containing protein [Clostridia bacterium]|nr:DUF4830 domain-containing protein [Clostridia bacterium]